MSSITGSCESPANLLFRQGMEKSVENDLAKNKEDKQIALNAKSNTDNLSNQPISVEKAPEAHLSSNPNLSNPGQNPQNNTANTQQYLRLNLRTIKC